ncbi:MAG TPA: hypothetical protein VE988_07635 [Gemmataceae bacterium]|nr:hypothetical protein [Gemmataceae bacterium]
MPQSTFTLPLERKIEVQRPVVDLVAPSQAEAVAAPTQEQADAVENVFADQTEERNTLIDAINVAAVGMLLHDVVKDTLAGPANDEEDEQPKAKPQNPDPSPD